VEAITGARGAFRVQLTEGSVEARRILFATGMIDDMLPLEGFSALWGSSVFQCPYCHGWEVKERRWGYLARTPEWSHITPFTVMLRGWSRDVTLFTSEALDLPDASRAQLEAAGVRVETSPVKRLHARGQQLESVELSSGASVPCDVLFAHPPQRQVALVQASGVALDSDGFVQIDPMRRETSVPGIYAAGDLTTRMQGAVIAAAAGGQAAAMINFELTVELAANGGLD
jgi:thioredoxin reductase